MKGGEGDAAHPRPLRLSAHFFQQVEAVHARQRQVNQRRVIRLLVEQGKRFLGVIGPVGVDAIMSEKLDDDFLYVRLILDDQNTESNGYCVSHEISFRALSDRVPLSY